MIALPTTRYSGRASKKYKAKFWEGEYAKKGFTTEAQRAQRSNEFRVGVRAIATICVARLWRSTWAPGLCTETPAESRVTPPRSVRRTPNPELQTLNSELRRRSLARRTLRNAEGHLNRPEEATQFLFRATSVRERDFQTVCIASRMSAGHRPSGHCAASR